jgi:hypothetical protein
MHLQLASDAPVLLRAAAAAALITHVGGATIGMISGLAALAVRKGGRLHRWAGTVFFVAMLGMSAVATVVAPLLADSVSALMGAFVLYLITTSWAVVRRPAQSVGRFEMAACVWVLAVGAIAFGLGRIGSLAPDGLIEGQPYQIAYVLGVVTLLAASADLRVIRRGGLAGPARIRRHLWRMCVALAITLGSAAAQPRFVAVLPSFIRHSGAWLIAPALTVLALMVFWLVRTRMWRRRRPAALAMA